MPDLSGSIFKNCWESEAGFPEPAGISRDDFLEWLFEQDLQPALYHQIRSRLPADSFLEFLQPEYARQSLMEMRRFEEFQAVAAEFKRLAIPFIVLKGTALAYLVYPHPHLRPRCDTDLLIRFADLPKVKEIISNLGYARENAPEGDFISYQMMACKEDPWGMPHVLDIHWKLSNPQLFADLFEWEELWRESSALPKLHSAAKALSPVHRLLHACIHQAAHHPGNSESLWKLDLYWITKSFSLDQWQESVLAASEKGILRILEASFEQAQDLISIRIPEIVRENLLKSRSLREPTAEFLRPGFSVKDSWISDFKKLPAGKKLRLLKEHLFPSPRYLREKYAGGRFLWLPWLYMRRLFSGAAKWLKK